MATRCLMAMEYSDWHAGTVLRKHSKKRPLGDLESRYQYTPPQPVLSCRTVDIDVAGTRTYRPLSTTDIISEQHRLIHNLIHKSRTLSSAPSTRSSRKGLGEILGSNGRAGQNTKNRAKNAKPATDSFMVLAVDKDLMDMRRFQNELTNQIHAHWRPESNHLNQGLFVRGQASQSDVTPSLDAWLTFGGGQSEASGGVIDAFTNVDAADDYYNVDGSVGSRIAMQLKKGDRIRIGVNGRVVTHDLKVKKWLKEDGGEDKDDACEQQGDERETEEGEKKEISTEASPAAGEEKPAADELDFDFGEIVFDSMDKFGQEEEEVGTPKDVSVNRKVKRKALTLEIPLSWGDQVSRPEVKVVSPRVTPRNNEKENLCETHPVFFQKLLTGDPPRPRLASATSGHGYRVKQRALGHTRRDNRFDTNSKVKAITVDRLSPEDELHLSNMSVDDVVQHRLDQTSPAGSAKARSSMDNVSSKKGSAPEKSLSGSSRRSATSKSKQQSGSGKGLTSLATGDGVTGRSRPTARSGSPGNLHVTWSSSNGLNVTSSCSRSMSEARHKPGSARSQGKGVVIGRTAPLHRAGLGLGGSVSSINIGPLPGDTEYIQIAQPIRNRNAFTDNGVRSPYSHYSMYGADPSVSWGAPPRRNMTSQDILGPPLEPVDMAHAPRPLLQQAGHEQGESPHPPSPEPAEEKLTDRKGPSQPQPEGAHTPVPDLRQQSASAMAISIPTADNLSDRESPTPLVTADGRLLGKGEDERQMTLSERRELSVRNHHIDHITDLLAGALLEQGQN